MTMVFALIDSSEVLDRTGLQLFSTSSEAKQAAASFYCGELLAWEEIEPGREVAVAPGLCLEVREVPLP